MAEQRFDLGQGLASFGQSFGQGLAAAMQQYHEEHQKVDASDALMRELSQTIDPATQKPVVDKKAYEDYLSHSSQQRAALAGAKIGAMKIIQSGQEAFIKTRREMAQTNEALARASALYSGAGGKAGATGTAGKVPVQIGGQTVYVTGNEAARLNQQEVSNQLQTKYGLTPEDILNPKEGQHATVEPVFSSQDTSAKKTPIGYKKSETGALVAVGGEDVVNPEKPQETMRTGGVVIPQSEFNVFKNRLKMAQKPAETQPNVVPSTALPPAPEGKVYVRSPQGVMGMVPAANLEAARKMGYMPVTQ
jgi:hypothetical protein